MSNDHDWIATRVGNAKKTCASVTPTAAARLEELLKGKISDRQLPQAELTKIAKELILDMNTPEVPEAPTDHEN